MPNMTGKGSFKLTNSGNDLLVFCVDFWMVDITFGTEFGKCPPSTVWLSIGDIESGTSGLREYNRGTGSSQISPGTFWHKHHDDHKEHEGTASTISGQLGYSD